MAVWALGLNHTTAPLDLRGRFAFAVEQIEPTLRALRESLTRQPEAAIISTCNRTEIYCAGEKPELEHTLDWLAHSGGVSPALLRAHSYTLEDGLAARHACAHPRRGNAARSRRTARRQPVPDADAAPRA